MSLLDELYSEIDKNHLWESKRILRRGEYLSMKGSMDTNVYYVCTGSLKIAVLTSADEHILRLAYKADFVVALDSFISKKPSNLYIQALKKTELKVVSKSRLQALLTNNQQGYQLWNDVLQQLLLQQLERETDLMLASPKERLARILSRSPQLFQEIPGKYIAAYLRMSPETLSRLQKQYPKNLDHNQ